MLRRTRIGINCIIVVNQTEPVLNSPYVQGQPPGTKDKEGLELDGEERSAGARQPLLESRRVSCRSSGARGQGCVAGCAAADLGGRDTMARKELLLPAPVSLSATYEATPSWVMIQKAVRFQ